MQEFIHGVEKRKGFLVILFQIKVARGGMHCTKEAFHLNSWTQRKTYSESTQGDITPFAKLNCNVTETAKNNHYFCKYNQAAKYFNTLWYT